MADSYFINMIFLLTIAVAAVWVFRRFSFPAILAYLFVGVITGPSLLDIVPNQGDIHFVAELGIVFLLFSLGLEFSLPKLMAMRHLVFGVGLLQVSITSAVVMLLSLLFGFSWQASLAIGAILALSSTAVVIKQLNEQNQLKTKSGQLAVAILLFQDIAVVPFLIALPILAGNGEQSIATALAMAVVKGTIVMGMLLAFGKWVLPRIFNEVARTRTDELFVLTTILVALMAGAITHAFGLSMALGAFIAGMMLGESQYRHQLEADIKPFRDILMGLFFITVGMQLNMHAIASQAFNGIVLLVALVVAKTLIIFLITRFTGHSSKDGWATGIKLCQVGEFGFVLAALALDNKLLDDNTTSLLLGVGIISMALTPLFVQKSLFWAEKLVRKDDSDNKAAQIAKFKVEISDHVLILGYGRVGQTISRFIKEDGIPYVAVDADPVRIQECSAAGEPVYFGDVRSKDILKAAGIERARLVVISFDEHHQAMAIISTIRSFCPTLKVMVRTRTDEHLEELKQAGASEVVPETLEATLMLVSQALFNSGVPVAKILRRTLNERKNHYQFLHGFYPGESSEHMLLQTPNRLDLLHAVTLPDNSFAIGETIKSLNLEQYQVELHGMRRDVHEIEKPALGTLLEAQDVLILKGKARHVEKAERFLLEG